MPCTTDNKLSLSEAAGTEHRGMRGIESSNSHARGLVTLVATVGVTCFTGAAWAFSSVSPDPYMVSVSDCRGWEYAATNGRRESLRLLVCAPRSIENVFGVLNPWEGAMFSPRHSRRVWHQRVRRDPSQCVADLCLSHGTATGHVCPVSERNLGAQVDVELLWLSGWYRCLHEVLKRKQRLEAVPCRLVAVCRWYTSGKMPPVEQVL